MRRSRTFGTSCSSTCSGFGDEQTYAITRDLAIRLNHHLFDTLYHALALSEPRAVLVTADREYFRKASHLGQIELLADWSLA